MDKIKKFYKVLRRDGFSFAVWRTFEFIWVRGRYILREIFSRKPSITNNTTKVLEASFSNIRGTFVIPAYDREDMLTEAVRSIPHRGDLEIIIVLDGSPFGTKEAVRKLSAE